MDIPLNSANGEQNTVEGTIGSSFSQVEHLFLSKNYHFGWKRSVKEEQIKCHYGVHITC